jgi:nucleoside-diphosphate-sugar epimerase
VDDVVDAIIKAIELPALNTDINIGTGVETSIKELPDIISEYVDLNVEYVEGRAIDNISRRCLDIKKAEQLLDWSPRVSLREGIEKTIEWISSLTTCQK